MTTPPFAPVSARDFEVMAAQLGRPMRDVVGVAARCVCGNPLVVSTLPRLSDGTPFPTFYYLTHPGATAAMSELEATQVMVQFSEDLANDPQLTTSRRTRRFSPIATGSVRLPRSKEFLPVACPPG